MRTVVFSDTHLTSRFDPNLYLAMNRVVESADHVIINGDFWDGYLVSFDEFIESDWSNLFPILRNKRTTYIFGNHDTEEMADERVSFFSGKQLHQLHFKNNQHDFYVQHGHLVNQSIVSQLASAVPNSFSKAVNQNIDSQQARNTFVGHVTTKIEAHFDAVGNQFFKSHVGKLQPAVGRDYYIFGHTHTPYFSEGGSYLNPGRFTSETPGYILIDKTVSLKGVGSLG